MSRRLQRGVVVLPSAFTLGNLFLGLWATVSAARGHPEMAGWLIVLAAFMDMFDGRVAIDKRHADQWLILDDKHRGDSHGGAASRMEWSRNTRVERVYRRCCTLARASGPPSGRG